MEITSVYTDVNGQSHFEMLPVLMENKTEMGFISDPIRKVEYIDFHNVLPHQVWGYHNVSSKVYIIILDGELELEVSNGESKKFSKGDVILLDDRSGQGHKPSTFQNTVCGLVIHLEA